MAEIRVPELAESITEGSVAKWLKQPGDFVEKGDYLCELETDKVNVEIISDQDGYVKELLAEEGDTVQVGDVIAIVTAEAQTGTKESTLSEASSKAEETQVEVSKEPVKQESPAENNRKQQRPIASPAARKLAREKGINLDEIQASDPLGRIRVQDVEQANVKGITKNESKATTPTPKVTQPTTQEDPTKPTERIKMSRRRQTIANRLVEVQHTAAMLTTFNEIDMTAVMNLRKRRKDAFYEENDVRLGFMSFFTKAVVAALKKYPLLNAEIQGDEIVMKKFYDIGVAVAAEEGLVVPVVRDADRKSFAEIEGSILDLATKARNNKLAIKDLQGGTFTITNGGVFGSLLSTPILNAPQVGILGMHKIQLRPVAIDEERMENRPMMYIALSYDHRIVDGKEAVSFLATIKDILEDPEKLLLG